MINVGFTPVNAVPKPVFAQGSPRIRFAAEEQEESPQKKQPDPPSVWDKTKLLYKKYLGVAAMFSAVTTGASIVGAVVWPPATVAWQTVEGVYLLGKSLLTVGVGIDYWKKRQDNKFGKTVPKDKINTKRTITLKSFSFRWPKEKPDRAPGG